MNFSFASILILNVLMLFVAFLLFAFTLLIVYTFSMGKIILGCFLASVMVIIGSFIYWGLK